jgi:hypothetical protein
LFDQQTCLLYGSPCFRRGISLDVEEGVYECDLQLDLFAAQRRCTWQGRDLVEAAR